MMPQPPQAPMMPQPPQAPMMPQPPQAPMMPNVQAKPSYVFDGEAAVYKEILTPLFDRLVTEIPQGVPPDLFVRSLSQEQQNMLSMYAMFNEIPVVVQTVQKMIPNDPIIQSPQGAAWLAAAFQEVVRVEEGKKPK